MSRVRLGVHTVFFSGMDGTEYTRMFRQTLTVILSSLWLLCGGVLSVARAADNGTAPTSVLEQLKAKPLNQRVAVSIYEFRSQVSQITESSVTDMFMTALVKSGQFRVVERNRLNEGIAQEKRMNAAGQSTGTTAQHALRGAQYLFEGAVTEANAAVNSNQGGINIGGLQLGGSKSKDIISIDVRILDADSGDVLDSVTISHPVKASSVGISGTAALVSTIASARGGSASPFTPDISAQSADQTGIDATVRGCIEEAVLELAKRVDLPSAHE
jgi:curli biogenesis system outer membrane secretion channel CsgG